MPNPLARRPSASLLVESVRAIGKNRFEIRQRVSCPLEAGRLRYFVETWFFFPQSLQMNRWSYRPTDYRQSLKSYIRLGVPARPLESFLGAEGPDAQDLLADCSRYLDDVLWANSPEVRERYEDSLKLFCMAFRTSLLERKRQVLAMPEGEERTLAAHATVRITVRVLRRYRRLLRKRAEAVRPMLRVPAFLFCDEYLSIIVTQVLAELVRHLSPTCSRMTFIMACYGAQRFYRRRRYPDSMPARNGDNELPLFRWGVLKKYVDMPLFLTIQRGSGNSWLVYALYTLVAASAMSAALLLKFFWEDFTISSSSFFAVAVLAYICREHVKEGLKRKMFKVFDRWIPDRVLLICDEHNRRLGTCSELFRFADWDKLPKPVRNLRNRTHFVDILNAFHNEDVLYYSKKIDVATLPDPFHEGKNLLLDISRFDISDFLRHADEVMDEPQGGTDERALVGEKVYHVDMVRRITHRCGSELERFRIVLTHAGIRRIDEIKTLNPSGEGAAEDIRDTKDMKEQP